MMLVTAQTGCTHRLVFRKVLGPVLFSLYINDISDALSHTHHILFSDNIQIYLPCPPSNILHGLELASVDANAIFKFASANSLKLNPSKSKVIIFGSHIYVNSIDLEKPPSILVNSTLLPFVSEVLALFLCLLSPGRSMCCISRGRFILHCID